jgi:putative flavoprotein involved in K+ transport
VDAFTGKRVAIAGEGNSGAQILAEVSRVAETIWITQKEPRFLPDHIDGRYLFDAATQMYEAQKAGNDFKPPSFADIVMVEPVKDARSRNVLKSFRPFDHFTEDSIVWSDGVEKKIDAIIFCTGFKPSVKHLGNLHVINPDGKSDTAGTKSKKLAGLWFVGYGSWTGFASATLIGVGRSAKATVDEIAKYVSGVKEPQAS